MVHSHASLPVLQKPGMLRPKLSIRKRPQHIHRRSTSAVVTGTAPVMPFSKHEFSLALAQGSDHVGYFSAGKSLLQKAKEQEQRQKEMKLPFLPHMRPVKTRPLGHECDTSIVSLDDEERPDDDMDTSFLSTPKATHYTPSSSPPPLTRDSRNVVYMHVSSDMHKALFLPDDF